MSRFILFFLLQFFFNTLEAKPVELVMWHSLAGHLGAEIGNLAKAFNHIQQDYEVKLVYKGEYAETLTSFAAAFRAKQPPAIVQIFEVGTGTMLYPQGLIKPVEALMKEQGLFLPKSNFLPAIRSFYSDSGKLVALPFNTSIPVLYYNADALSKLGYSKESFPRTWDELEQLAIKLREAGYRCAYTTAYPAWIHIESFSALHGLSMIDKQSGQANYKNNGILRHLQRLKDWQKKHYLEYGGRASDATVLFTSGRCPLFSQSSGSHNSLAGLVKFRLGVAALPLDTQLTEIRHNNVAGGAALWAVAGHEPEIYRGVALFFAYLAQAEIQEYWHQQTGYLPLGLEGIYASSENNPHPILELARIDLGSQQTLIETTHLGPQNQIRTINDEALEAIFAGISSPEEAMDEAVKRANYALLRFKRNASD